VRLGRGRPPHQLPVESGRVRRAVQAAVKGAQVEVGRGVPGRQGYGFAIAALRLLGPPGYGQEVGQVENGGAVAGVDGQGPAVGRFRLAQAAALSQAPVMR